MSSNVDKVRFSRAGDDFHLLWTVRRSLQLINPKSDLIGVAIEGISPEEEVNNEEGLLSIDTAEYYRSEDINEARKIKYFQLKYSTLDSEKEWTAATISPRHKGKAKGTINSFAKKNDRLILQTP